MHTTELPVIDLNP